MDGIHIPPDAERVSRGTGTFRVLAELPELEIIDMRFGPAFEGVDLHEHDALTQAAFAAVGVSAADLRDAVERARGA